MAPTTSTIDFTIGDLGAGVPTKPIPLVALLNFHGLILEFGIVYRLYDYVIDAQKLRMSLLH